MIMTLEVRCKACGSRMIAHEQGYLVRSMVSEWIRTDSGHLDLVAFAGDPQVMFDSDIGDGGYVCTNCNHEFVDLDDETDVTPNRMVEAYHVGSGAEIRDAARAVLRAWRERSVRFDELMDQLEQAVDERGGQEAAVTGFDKADDNTQAVNETDATQKNEGASVASDGTPSTSGEKPMKRFVITWGQDTPAYATSVLEVADDATIEDVIEEAKRQADATRGLVFEPSHDWTGLRIVQIDDQDGFPVSDEIAISPCGEDLRLICQNVLSGYVNIQAIMHEAERQNISVHPDVAEALRQAHAYVISRKKSKEPAAAGAETA